MTPSICRVPTEVSFIFDPAAVPALERRLGSESVTVYAVKFCRRPGTFADLCAALRERGIPFRAVTVEGLPAGFSPAAEEVLTEAFLISLLADPQPPAA